MHGIVWRLPDADLMLRANCGSDRGVSATPARRLGWKGAGVSADAGARQFASLFRGECLAGARPAATGDREARDRASAGLIRTLAVVVAVGV